MKTIRPIITHGIQMFETEDGRILSQQQYREEPDRWELADQLAISA